MRGRASKFEIFIDSQIPYALVAIVALTIFEIAFPKLANAYFWAIDLIDLWVVWIFMMDLIFKFEHAKSIPEFLGKYWIYIIGVFPFFLVLRIVERFYHVSISALSPSSTIIISRYLASLLTEARMVQLMGLLRFLGLSSRLLRAAYFYENPKVRHRIRIKKLLGIKTKRRKKR